MVSVKDVARHAHVSTATVSRVLNNSGYVSPALRERVHDAVRELGYEANPFARGLKIARSHTIGLIISTIENPFFASVVRGVESVVYPAGYSLVLCNTDSDPGRERSYLHLLRQKRVDGLIISTSGGADDDIAALVKRGVPVVLLNRRLRADLPQVDGVVSDSREGARQAVAHLISLGHRRVAIVAGPSDHLQGSERLAGYQQALSEAGLPVDEAIIRSVAFTADAAYQATCDLLAKKAAFTALFVSNNLQALGAMRALREHGVKVPDEVAFVAFDEVDWAPYIDPPLTVVAQQAHQIGVTAARRLLGRLSGKVRGAAKELVLPTKLIVRASSGVSRGPSSPQGLGSAGGP